MKNITIIGSGMAAAQLIRDIRKKQSSNITITVISPLPCHTYSKPHLSMLWRMKKAPESVISLSHSEFCETFQVQYIQSKVTSIDSKKKVLSLSEEKDHHYDTLVMANGARPNNPFNESGYLFDYNSSLNLHQKVEIDSNIGIIGGGLIGCEIADDISHKVKKGSITLLNAHSSLLNKYVPSSIASNLQQALEAKNITVEHLVKIKSLKKQEGNYLLESQNKTYEPFNFVITALGMSVEPLNLPQCSIYNTYKANQHLEIKKDIYGLGDCISIDGQYKPYIQPMIYQSNILSNILTQTDGPKKVSYPLFTINIKTPSCPIAIIGSVNPSDTIEYKEHSNGIALALVDNKVKKIIICGQEALRQKMELEHQFHSEMML